MGDWAAAARHRMFTYIALQCIASAIFGASSRKQVHGRPLASLLPRNRNPRLNRRRSHDGKAVTSQPSHAQPLHLPRQMVPVSVPTSSVAQPFATIWLLAGTGRRGCDKAAASEVFNFGPSACGIDRRQDSGQLCCRWQLLPVRCIEFRYRRSIITFSPQGP